MPLISKITICLAGIFHVLFFIMESILFMRERVYNIFGATTLEEAQIMANFAYNQGFYNLFLAFGAIGGVLLANKMKENVGNTMALFASFCMIGAGIVLFFSTGKVLGTFIQAGVPAIGVLFFFIQSKEAAPKS